MQASFEVRIRQGKVCRVYVLTVFEGIRQQPRYRMVRVENNTVSRDVINCWLYKGHLGPGLRVYEAGRHAKIVTHHLMYAHRDRVG